MLSWFILTAWFVYFLLVCRCVGFINLTANALRVCLLPMPLNILGFPKQFVCANSRGRHDDRVVFEGEEESQDDMLA